MRTVVTVKVHLKRQSTAFDLNRWVFKCFETSLGSLSLSPHVLAQKKHTLICLRFSFSSLQKICIVRKAVMDIISGASLLTAARLRSAHALRVGLR